MAPWSLFFPALAIFLFRQRRRLAGLELLYPLIWFGTVFVVLSIALGKRTFYEQDGLVEQAAYGLACAVMVDNALIDDAHEGMRAFLEKRKPEWPSR